MKISTAIISLCLPALLASLACRKNAPGAGVIRSISPDSGHFGTLLTIQGEGFDTVNGYITIDGVTAPIKQSTATTFTVWVPTTHTGEVVVKTNAGASTTGPVFTYGDDVLVAGGLIGFGPYYPCYWDNGEPFELITSVGATNSIATGIASSGDDIYVCGYLYYGANPMAELWKNGVEQTLTSNTQYAEAVAIRVSGQNVYVVGYLNDGTHDIATLWLNGQATALGGDTVNSYASAITLAGNDVYVAGYRGQPNSPNHVALYWKNGIATTLSDGTADASTTGIAFAGADLCVSGNMAGGVLWKNGSAQPQAYVTEGLCGYGDALYLAGESSGYNYNSSGVWSWGNGFAGFDLGGISVNAVTADNAGVYTANATPNGNIWQPSYSVQTGAGLVTTVLLARFGDVQAGNAWGICVRH